MIKNKKASHVGMILSFVIFITFLVFLFSILGDQTKVPQEKEPLLDYLEQEIMNQLEENFTMIRISVPEAPEEEECIMVDLDSLDFRYSNAIIEGEDVEISNDGKFLSFDWDGDKQVFDIFLSDKFNRQVGPKSGCYEISKIKNNQDIQFIRPNKYVFNESMNALKNRHDNEYVQLKEDFNIPGMEFSFNFKDENKDILFETEEKDVSTNVYSREISMQYFDNLGNLNSGFINFRIW